MEISGFRLLTISIRHGNPCGQSRGNQGKHAVNVQWGRILNGVVNGVGFD